MKTISTYKNSSPVRHASDIVFTGKLGQRYDFVCTRPGVSFSCCIFTIRWHSLMLNAQRYGYGTEIAFRSLIHQLQIARFDPQPHFSRHRR
jgi:hypothetical protein